MTEPRTLIDRYELGDLIGAGGSARVYEAYDRLLERRVAVKVLDRAVAETTDPAGHARFLREGRSSARFDHPNVVATFDAGADDDTLFIVMEHVEGTSLAHVIAEEAPLADERTVRIGTQLLSALGAAHSAGIIHRDIKPANVLLDTAGDVKLADFGIARRFDEITSSLTVEGMVVGTRGYLAPEQARGLETGPAVDLYAVGAVLFEMATGERPPAASTVESVTDPRTVRPAVSPALAGTIATAMAFRPEDRFGSASAMAAALAGDHLPPTQLAIATPPTAVIGAAPSPPTQVMPSPGAHLPPERRALWGFVLIGLLALGVALLARALTGGSDGSIATQPDVTGDISSETTPATVAAIEVTIAPTSPPTSPPTTSPPTTPPTTTPATTTPEEPPELIPGFPATNDIEQFIEQLRDDKVAGKQSKKLGDGLRDVVEKDADDREKEREKLIEKIEEWLDDEEIDPVVAARAIAFLDELEVESDE